MAFYLFLIFALNSWAAIPNQSNQLKDFYKSPYSFFSSGQATYDELIKKRESAQTLKIILVEVGKYQEWLPAKQLYTIHDFQHHTLSPMSAYTKTNAIIYRKKNDNWTPFERLKKGSAFNVDQMISGWACGKYNNDYVCLANDQIVMAIDLAKTITTKNGKSYEVVDRKENQIITSQNNVIPWNEIQSWTANNELALIKSSPLLMTQGNLTPYERVKIRDYKMQYWIESTLRPHGKVWWLMNNPNLPIAENTLILSTQEIKERGIFDKAENKNSLSLVSAKGIFISQEKDTWKLLNKFEESNHPVAIGFNKLIFVGDQYSKDTGNSFEPYIRWDIISAIIQEKIGIPADFIRITKIYIPNEKQKNVYFQIETGFGKFTFSTNLNKKSVHLIQ
jgi:hypothetical protein